MGRHWEAPFNDQRMQLLEGVTRALSAPGDLPSSMRLGAGSVVPDLAQSVVLVVRKGVEDQLEVVHADPDQETRIADRLRPLLPTLRKAAARDRLSSREFRWIPSVNEASTRFLRGEPELLQVLHEFNVGSLMVVPLRSGGRIWGAMAFARHDRAAPSSGGRHRSAHLHERSLDQESQRGRLEDALQKWIQVFDLAGWGAAVVDGNDRRIEAVNPAFARLHGYSEADTLTGRLFAELLPTDGSWSWRGAGLWTPGPARKPLPLWRDSLRRSI